MKTASLVSLATVVARAASVPFYMGHPVDPQHLSQDVREKFEKRQLGGLLGGGGEDSGGGLLGGLLGGGGDDSGGGGLLGGLLGGGDGSLIGDMLNPGSAGKVDDPPDAAPKEQELEPRVEGARTVKIRYGPYNIPNATVENSFSGHSGTLFNYPDSEAPKPCESCVIVGMNAGLEYPDGTNANINTGLWLHHYVHFAVGPGRTDATCSGVSLSLPHMIIGSSPEGSERMFSSGNERTPAFASEFTAGDSPVGYHLRAEDKFRLIVDLMNENQEDKIAYLTVTYDVIDGSPDGYDDMRPVWFDADQCGTSEVQPPQDTGAFEITAETWNANFDGQILGYAGHLHDGGTELTLSADGTPVCTSVAKYAETPEFVSQGGHSHGGEGSATEHISSMSICTGEELAVKELKQGQKWDMTGYYDYDRFNGSVGHDGHQESIMGIAIMFVRTPAGAATSPDFPSGGNTGGGIGSLLGGLGGGGGLGGLLGGGE